MPLEMTEFNPPERLRTYWFPLLSQGDVELNCLLPVDLENVTHLKVSDSGTHRLKTKDGRLHIIPTGWLHISIDADDWTC